MQTAPYYHLDLSTGNLVRYLAIIVMGLLVVHSVLQVWHYQWYEVPWPLQQLFDVDEEDSIPTWYSASALLLASALLYIISQRKRADGDRCPVLVRALIDPGGSVVGRNSGLP